MSSSKWSPVSRIFSKIVAWISHFSYACLLRSNHSSNTKWRLRNQLANSIEQSPSWETSSHLPDKEIGIFWNPKVEVSVFVSGMWRHVTGSLLPYVSKHLSGLIFEGRNVLKIILRGRFLYLPSQRVCLLILLYAEEHCRVSSLTCSKRSNGMYSDNPVF